MILLTVGTQLPFDRLVRALDAWCAASGRTDVFGQIGAVGSQGYRPKHFEWSEFLAPGKLDQLARQADLVVAHAGMGSIISALQYAKPIVIMPRRGALGEHRNDHQLATAARFADRNGVFVADDESVLPEVIARALKQADGSLQSVPDCAQPALINAIRSFILFGVVPADPVDS